MTTADDSRPTRVAIDPRIRQRRLDVLRDEGRRRLRLVVGIAMLAAIVLAGWGLTRSPLLDVDTVRVRGAAHSTPEEVTAAAGLDRHPPMLELEEKELAAAIEALPWVDSARVRKDWPGTVEVTLLERTALAAVPGENDQWTLLDPTGRVLAHQQGQPPEMTRIELASAPGEPGSRVAAPARAALGIVESLPAPLAGRVPTIRVAQDATIELVLDGKIPVRFGPASDIRAKVVALTTLVQKADLARTTSIDVRAPTAPVLTRR